VGGKAIERANAMYELRRGQKYALLAERLKLDLQSFSANQYAINRIRNELADLFTFQLFDLEAAIALDQELVVDNRSVVDTTGLFVPRSSAASGQIVADSTYIKAYIDISQDQIRKAAQTRLELNRTLLLGSAGVNSRKTTYEKSYLLEYLKQVKTDVGSTYAGTSDRTKLLSRLIRAEYELVRLTPGMLLEENKHFLDGSLTTKNFDSSEIDFLSLADYLSRSYRSTGDIRFAELALRIVYLPYQKLSNRDNRWRYNKLINRYISDLIEGHVKADRNIEALYFISLNKSRMLLEEKFTYLARIAKTSFSAIAAEQAIVSDSDGLPSQEWFRRQVSQSKGHLDFYVDGGFVAVSVGDTSAANSIPARQIALMPLNSRNAGALQDNSEGPPEEFVDTALFVSTVINGQVKIKRYAGSELEKIRADLEESYLSISGNLPRPSVQALKGLVGTVALPPNHSLSTDKWVSKFPISVLLDTPAVRSVSFFTTGGSSQLQTVRVAGMFNPKLLGGRGDLPGAQAEASRVKAIFPSAQLLTGEQATVRDFEKLSESNVIHLSMHGHFNSAEPMRSKLLLAGARYDGGRDDSNALFAEDIVKVSSLTGRDLVFAAACQTGLVATDRTNESELTGLLRPLAAGSNRNLILSLWNISDAATADFVQSFYDELNKTKNIDQSFTYAQQTLKRKYSHPYYWSAFYLLRTQ
jgi:hypothetical protein